MNNILTSAEDTLATLGKAFDTLRPFLEDLPGVDIFDKIIAAAHIGVGNAEQLYNIGQLEPGARKLAAHEYIVKSLNLMGVAVTPEISKLIGGAIEAEVLELGHFAKIQTGTIAPPLDTEISAAEGT